MMLIAQTKTNALFKAYIISDYIMKGKVSLPNHVIENASDRDNSKHHFSDPYIE